MFLTSNKATAHVTETGEWERLAVIKSARLLIVFRGYPEDPTTRLVRFPPSSS
jgi:hypothetical protein